MGWLTWVGAGQVEPGGEADCRIDLDGGLPQVLSVREQQKRLHHLRAAARVAQQRDRARTVELQPLHCQAEGRGQRAEDSTVSSSGPMLKTVLQSHIGRLYPI